MSRFEYQISLGELEAFVVRNFEDLESAISSAFGFDTNLRDVVIEEVSKVVRLERTDYELTVTLNHALRLSAYVTVRRLG